VLQFKGNLQYFDLTTSDILHHRSFTQIQNNPTIIDDVTTFEIGRAKIGPAKNI